MSNFWKQEIASFTEKTKSKYFPNTLKQEFVILSVENQFHVFSFIDRNIQLYNARV